jgi:hypothetical protein
MRYYNSILRRHLDSLGYKNVRNTIPLPNDFIPTVEDFLDTEEKAYKIADEYELDYTSCIGLFIYLFQTSIEIIYAVNKLAKYIRKPGEVHF